MGYYNLLLRAHWDNQGKYFSEAKLGRSNKLSLSHLPQKNSVIKAKLILLMTRVSHTSFRGGVLLPSAGEGRGSILSFRGEGGLSILFFGREAPEK